MTLESRSMPSEEEIANARNVILNHHFGFAIDDLVVTLSRCGYSPREYPDYVAKKVEEAHEVLRRTGNYEHQMEEVEKCKQAFLAKLDNYKR